MKSIQSAMMASGQKMMRVAVKNAIATAKPMGTTTNRITGSTEQEHSKWR